MRLILPYPLAHTAHLPATGELHPLKKESVKWISWSEGFVLFTAAAIFASWYLWSHRTPEEIVVPDAGIVNIVELGVPPPITQPSAPQVNVADIAPPTIGVPEPVPEVQAKERTIATQEEMGFLSTPTMNDLGGTGGRDSIVVGDYTPPNPDGANIVDELPVRLSVPQPDYPELAKQAGVTGTVIIKALVGRDGRVKKAVVESGGPEMLQKPAVDAAYKAVFRPGLQQNTPVEVWVRIPYAFTLD